MKINEVEQAVGITKKNIRFYEQEGLLNPSRAANGYRDYSAEDLEILQRIKLFRMLAIPLEEIRRLQSDELTLSDCLRRHMIVLERKRENLDAIEQFCSKILSEDMILETLPVEKLLLEMENMEKGGAKFVNIRQRDKKKKKQDSMIAAGVTVALMSSFLLLVIWAALEAPIPIWLIIFVVAFPTMGILGTLLALKERFKEIEGGELDEASKY